MRAFVALDLDAAFVRAAGDLVATLRQHEAVAGASWTPPEKLHVTVAFLGDEVTDAHVRELTALLGASPHAPLTLGIRGLDAFPAPDRAGALVLSVDEPTGALARLASSVGARASALGLPQDDRPYRPHVTLARLRTPADVRSLGARALPSSLATARTAALALYRSDPRDGYVALARAPDGSAQPRPPG